MSKYPLAPEFASQPTMTIPGNRTLLKAAGMMLKLERRKFSWDDRVDVREHSIPEPAATPFPSSRSRRKTSRERRLRSSTTTGAGSSSPICRSTSGRRELYALEGRCRVYYPDYRLSVDHPFPGGFDDCYATLSWVHANAADLSG